MALRLYDTLTGTKREFAPLEGNRVRMYTCGPTVYDHAHIGNLRTFLFEDLLRRFLKYLGYEVVQVMNLTDVDDKTIAGSQREGVPLREYTERYAQAFFDDIRTLRIEPAEYYPRATDHIPEMQEMIRTLLEKGFAYVSNGAVYYAIVKFPAYGQLSKFHISEVLPGARVDVDEYEKENPRDFVLWKEAKEGEPTWDSPWGKGRPGWHIECSAMSRKYLGNTFDIHTGGVDNIFPHHENEIAQSEAALGQKFVNFWLHSEFLLVNGEKMAKSKGNYYTLRDLLAKGYAPLAIRHSLISAHYRHQLNFTEEGLRQSVKAVERLHDFYARLKREKPAEKSHPEVAPLIADTERQFREAGEDDLNIPKGMGHLFDFIRQFHTSLDDGLVAAPELESARQMVERVDQVVGLLPSPEEEPLDPALAALIAERDAARRARDFPRADAIRKELLEKGIVLEDQPEGTRWKRMPR